MNVFKGIILLLFVGLVGCIDMGDWTGITELETFSDELSREAVVAGVICENNLISVGESVNCEAYNESGTRITVEGIKVVLWRSSDPLVAPVTLDGNVTGQTPGTSWIIAEGTYSSKDSFNITVN